MLLMLPYRRMGSMPMSQFEQPTNWLKERNSEALHAVDY